MKTKTIPFDLETAKKIQAGEIEGKIKRRDGKKARILSTDVRTDEYPMVVATTMDSSGKETVDLYTLNGIFTLEKREHRYDLVLEVPDNEPQFKPFDRVLVRDSDLEKWFPRHFAWYDKIEILYFTTSGYGWKQCIPYEGNEHLAGTTDEPSN